MADASSIKRSGRGLQTYIAIVWLGNLLRENFSLLIAEGYGRKRMNEDSMRNGNE